MLFNRQGRCLTSNRPGLMMMQTRKGELIGRQFREIWPIEIHALIDEHVQKVLAGEQTSFEAYRMNGPEKGWWDVLLSPVCDLANQVNGYIAISSEITQRKKNEEEKAKLEAQLQQAQKMETVGRLAGGIAHDFNNIIFLILGYSELTLLHLDDKHPMREYLLSIKDAGEKATALTRQLLAFSRKQVLEVKCLDLSQLIADMGKMLPRMLREDISFTLKTRANLPNVIVDQVQIEQVLMNLMVNARDAMPNGGRLVIETSAAELDDQYVRTHPGTRPGSYVLLTVTDNGEGMSKKTMENIFEPFFSTKKTKGTGLGLSTVYGIVKQHSGHIIVRSEVGRGTTFRIYLPATDQEPEDPAEYARDHMPAGDETILVAEDDRHIRKLIQDILDPLGYRLLIAEDGARALQTGLQHLDEIDLLLTDVIMPEMNGRQLADALSARKPGLKTLFMSGYTDETISQHGILESGIHFISKPLSPSKLANTLRKILNRKPG